MRFCLDIETTGLPEAAEYAEPVSAPANYKDEAKIAAYIAEKQAEQVGRAALDLDLCRVVAIGLMSEVTSAPTAYTGDERELLATLWDVLLKEQNPVLIGFNLIGFDLPVLIRRSQYLDVPHPHLVLDKYRTPHIDLMQRLTWNGLVKAKSLKFYAKRFGIPIDDTVNGKDIPALVEAGDWEAVNRHVKSDVRLTAALAQRLGVLPQPQAELVF
jgi:predicted PolB exonuclease-like 3'-5' exonuclease